jgi:membrane fusion protein (multidrug efflux system)
MRRTLINLAVCLAILAGGAVIVALASTPGDDSGSETVEATAAEEASNIEILVLESQTVEDLLLLTGRLEPWEDITVAAEATGPIEMQGVEEEQRVAAGDVLFKVDTQSVQARVDEARARFQLAEQELQRARDLRDRGVSSPQALDQALAERNMARAALTSADVALDKSVVTAPFDGVVTDLFREQGEFVDVGTDLCRLMRTDEMRVLVPIPERDIGNFGLGSEVSVTIDAIPGKELTGTIFKLDTAADQVTRTFTAEVKFENPDDALKPGMTVRAALVRDTYENAVTVPLFAVIALENQRFVFVEEDGTAVFRPIEVGRIHGDRVHVTEGLSPGEHLIIKGQRELRDGAAVRVLSGDAA